MPKKHAVLFAAAIGVVVLLLGLFLALPGDQKPGAQDQSSNEPEDKANTRLQEKQQRELQLKNQQETEAKQKRAEEAKSIEAHAKLDAAQLDPESPVAKDKIEGDWWLDKDRPHKAFIFVEEFRPSGLVAVTLPDGRAMALHCNVTLTTTGSFWGGTGQYPGGGECYLPFHTWVRVSIGDIVRDGARASANAWGVGYHPGGDRVDYWNIVAFCDPNCKSLEDKVLEELASDADLRRRGLK